MEIHRVLPVVWVIKLL